MGNKIIELALVDVMEFLHYHTFFVLNKVVNKAHFNKLNLRHRHSRRTIKSNFKCQP